MSNYIEWYYNPEGDVTGTNSIKKEYIVHYIRRAFSRHNYMVKKIQVLRTIDGFDKDNYPYTIRIYLIPEDIVYFTLKDTNNANKVLDTLQELVRSDVKNYRGIPTWTL